MQNLFLYMINACDCLNKKNENKTRKINRIMMFVCISLINSFRSFTNVPTHSLFFSRAKTGKFPRFTEAQNYLHARVCACVFAHGVDCLNRGSGCHP